MSRDTAEVVCSWLTYLAADGETCLRVIDLDPMWLNIWQNICWSTVVFQILTIVWTSHDVYRLWLRHKASEDPHTGVKRVRFWSNMLLWAQVMSMLGSLLMAIAYIDGWGFFKIWSLRAYLGIYPPAYALIPAHSITINLYLMQIIVLPRLGGTLQVSKKVIYGTMGLLVLILLYAVVGFPAFGWRLAYVFSRDQSSTLGNTGNILAYVMYGLVALSSIFGAVFTALLMRETGNTDPTTSYLIRGRMNKWAFVNIAASVWFLAISIHRQRHVKDPAGILSTFMLLGTNRLVELIFQWNTNSMQDANYAEPFLLVHYYNKIAGIKEEVSERRETTARTQTRTRSKTTGSKTTASRDKGKSSSGDVEMDASPRTRRETGEESIV